MTQDEPCTGRGSGEPQTRQSEAGGVWVVAEHVEGRVSEVTYETVAFAVRLASSAGASVSVVVLGASAPAVAHDIARKTGLPLMAVQVPGDPECHTEASRMALKELVSLSGPPAFLVAPHTTMGWDLAPALAVDLGAACITGVTGFLDEDGPVFSRRTFHGKLVEHVRPVRDRPAVLTVMPGSEPAEPTPPEKPGPVRLHTIGPAAGEMGARWVGRKPSLHAAARLRDAEVVVAAGRGVAAPEDLETLRTLAALFPRSALGASRPLCDMGWLPYDHQVGMTGQTVSPRLYIACGVSGAIQHTLGIRRADLIVSINTDPQAPFSGRAHCCVVEDLHTFLPVLIDRIRAHMGPST